MASPKDDTQFEGTRDQNLMAATLDEDNPVVVHIIPQAHIDLAWQWTAADGVEMVVETFRAHVELLEADPSRTYAQSQLAAYEIVEREDAALFERIRALVAKGQWEIVGGAWVEPDRSLPGGEAIVRQLLEGQRYAEEHFGTRARVAWSPDSFTYHPGNLPQLLKQAGLTFQVLKRPREKWVSLPLVPFRWKGLDGTERVTYRSNNKGNGLPSLSEGTPAPPEGTSELQLYADAFRRIGLSDLWGPRGVGDTGGTNQYPEPTSGQGWSSKYSTPSRYAERLTQWGRFEELPEVEGGIGPIMTGCLTTHAEMKFLNRAAENVLQSAEFAISLSQILDTDRRSRSVQDGWRRVLFNQFHDVVTGVGIPEAHVEAAHDYEEAILQARKTRRAALRTVSERVEPADERLSLLVVNELGWARTDVVCAEIDLGEETTKHWEAVAPDGTASPVTLHGVKRAQSWKRHRVSFVAKDVPAMGYRVYGLRPVQNGQTLVSASGNQLITDDLTFRLDSRSGVVAALMNRTDAVQFHTGLARPRLHEEGKYFLDYGVEHRAWYLGLNGVEKPVEFVGLRSLREDPTYAELETVHRFGASEMRQRYIVRPDLRRVDVDVTIDWHEIEHLVRIHFPTGLDGKLNAAFDSAYAVTLRDPDGVEMPMQTFCDLSNGEEGLGILNDGRYGAAADGSELTISAVRCSTRPDPRSDEGIVKFRYAMVPHVGTWRDGDLLRQGHGFNRPLLGIAMDTAGVLDRVLPREWSLVSGNDESVLPVVLKPAYDGDGWALRMYNSSSRPTTAEITFDERIRSVCPTTILEDRPRKSNDIGSRVNMRPFEVATWLLSGM